MNKTQKLAAIIGCDTRRKILAALAEGAKTGVELKEPFNHPPSTFSRHINSLVDLGLVKASGKGGRSGLSYTITKKGAAIAAGIDALLQSWG